jgi:hypothetical protein
MAAGQEPFIEIGFEDAAPPYRNMNDGRTFASGEEAFE